MPILLYLARGCIGDARTHAVTEERIGLIQERHHARNQLVGHCVQGVKWFFEYPSRATRKLNGYQFDVVGQLGDPGTIRRGATPGVRKAK